eukprot:766522-Hanusia_phi.AAC.5
MEAFEQDQGPQDCALEAREGGRERGQHAGRASLVELVAAPCLALNFSVLHTGPEVTYLIPQVRDDVGHPREVSYI